MPEFDAKTSDGVPIVDGLEVFFSESAPPWPNLTLGRVLIDDDHPPRIDHSKTFTIADTFHVWVFTVQLSDGRMVETSGAYVATSWTKVGNRAMSEHRLIPARKIRYPGGKDGWHKAECTCGRSATEAYPGRAERRINDHIRDKETGQ